MNNKLSNSGRDFIQANIFGLEYEKIKESPHFPAIESFICNECKCVIIFPLVTAK